MLIIAYIGILILFIEVYYLSKSVDINQKALIRLMEAIETLEKITDNHKERFEIHKDRIDLVNQLVKDMIRCYSQAVK